MNRARGFQLVEVVVAGAIFFLIAFFVLNLLPTSQLAVARTETRMSGETLAYNVLDELRAGPFQNLVVGETELPSKKLDNVEFELRYRIDTIEDTDPDLVKAVVVTVSWTEGEETRSVKAYSNISAVQRF